MYLCMYVCRTTNKRLLCMYVYMYVCMYQCINVCSYVCLFISRTETISWAVFTNMRGREAMGKCRGVRGRGKEEGEGPRKTLGVLRNVCSGELAYTTHVHEAIKTRPNIFASDELQQLTNVGVPTM